MVDQVFRSSSVFVDPTLPALKWLADLADQQHILAIDYHFASLMVSQLEEVDDETNNLVALFAAKLSHQIAKQNTCLKLDDFDPTFTFGVVLSNDISIPSKDKWRSLLVNNNLAQEYFRFSDVKPTSKPFVLFDDVLYLQKFFEYDFVIAQRLKQNFESCLASNEVGKVDVTQLLDNLFGPIDTTEPDNQRIAVEDSLTSAFALITGGPGTGKTTTVVKLLAAQQLRQKQMGLPPLKQVLLAPTGKASQRLSESIIGSKANLTIDSNVLDLIPEQTSTIHRYINSVLRKADSALVKPKVDADVLLIDEASMVDVSLMAKLLRYTPIHTQIILLGDEQQLASVEAGNLLSDLAQVNQGCTVSRLTKSYRFNDDSSIGRLSRSIKEGNIELVRNSLSAQDNAVRWISPNANDFALLINEISDYYVELRRFSGSELDISEILFTLRKLQVLCCTREGPFGVNTINNAIEKRLSQRLKLSSSEHYAFRPIMVSENAYHLSLYNGDIGIELEDKKTGKLYAYFTNDLGEVIRVSTQRLPKHETVYAMTVHKSQGSEFDKVVMFLPEQSRKTLSREILYTGLTRAKKQFVLYGSDKTIQQSITTKTNRTSGLTYLSNSP